MFKNKVRSASFSHSEPFIVNKSSGDKYQIIAKLVEVENENFIVEICAFNTTLVLTETSNHSFDTISEALKWIISIFEAFHPFGPPEVLYLPEWRDESEVEACFKKWSDGLFGVNYVKIIKDPELTNPDE